MAWDKGSEVTTVSAISTLMLDVYSRTITEEINRQSAIMGELTEFGDEIKLDNGQFLIPVIVNEPKSVGARADNANLPPPQSANVVYPKETPRYVYGTAEWTGPVVARCVGNPGAIRDEVEKNMATIPKQMTRRLNGMWWGNSRGVVARVASGPVATVYTLTQPDLQLSGLGLNAGVSAAYVAAEWATGNGMVGCCRRLEVGELVGLYTNAGLMTAVGDGGLRITAIDPDLGTITLSAAATTAVVANSTNLVVSASADDTGDRSCTEYDQAWRGLGDVMGIAPQLGTTGGGKTATFLGITTAAFPDWMPYVGHNSGNKRTCTDSLIINWRTKSRKWAGERADFHVCQPTLITGIYDGIKQKIRTTPGNQVTGYSKVTVETLDGPVDFFTDDYAWSHCVVGLVKSKCGYKYLLPPQWDSVGGVMKQVPEYRDAYWSKYKCFGNFIWRDRRSVSILADLIQTEPLG